MVHNAILIYVESSLAYVSKFEGILFNFSDFCPESDLWFCMVFIVRFYGFKIKWFFDGLLFLRFLRFSGVQFYLT